MQTHWKQLSALALAAGKSRSGFAHRSRGLIARATASSEQTKDELRPMKIVFQLNDRQIETLHGNLYQNEWWTKGRTLAETKAGVQGSQICVGLVDEQNNDQLVGFSRVLTDYMFKALIFDVIVDPKHRGSGLGDKLLGAILNHDKLSNVKHFELYCAPEMKEYYQRFDFSADVGVVGLMRKTKPN